MTVAQKAPFELVALDGPASADSPIPSKRRRRWPAPSKELPGWTAAAAALRRLGIGIARRRVHLQMVGERLGITEQFQGVDQITVARRWQRSKFWSASKAAGTRCRCARRRRRCWVGPPAICRSRATIRRSAWRTCAP